MTKVMELYEEQVASPVENEAILQNVKMMTLKQRANAKHNQSSNFSALRRYINYGADYVKRTTLSNAALMALESKELIDAVQQWAACDHRILYYGPLSQAELKAALEQYHKVAEERKELTLEVAIPQQTPKSEVVLAQYNAKQIYYYQFSNRGEQYDAQFYPALNLYNEYFGGGMNAIVFQEMREARGLAYSAQAYMPMPSYKHFPYTFTAFIATQNDKMQQAVEAFDEIINEMPESEAAFEVAKKALMERIRTQRIVKEQQLWTAIFMEDLGATANPDQALYEQLPTMTLQDVKATQEKWVKDRTYIYGILGDIKDLDMNFLRTLGPVRTVTQEEIFGY